MNALLKHTIFFLSSEPNFKSSIISVADNLHIEKSRLVTEIVLMKPNPNLSYDSVTETLSLSHSCGMNIQILNKVLQKAKKVNFIPHCVEDRLVDLFWFSFTTSEPWDRLIQFLNAFSDDRPTEHFLIKRIIETGSDIFGPLDSESNEQIINSRLGLVLPAVNKKYSFLPLLECEDSGKLVAFLRSNSILRSDFLAEKTGISPEAAESVLRKLQSMDVIASSPEFGETVCRLSPTKISILDIDNERLMVEFNQDFVEKLASEHKFKLQNPLPTGLIESTILDVHNRTRIGSEPRNALWQLNRFVMGLNLNTEGLIWEDPYINSAYRYHQQVQLPVEYSEPETVGDIIWAVKSIPSQLRTRTSTWVGTMVDRGVKKSLEITDRLSLDEVRCEDPFMLFLSRERAQQMLAILRLCFLHPSLDQIGNLCRLRFHLESDKKRIGKSSRCRVADPTFIYSLLELILHTHPRGIFLISDLSSLLGISQDELFVYLKRMDFLVEFYGEDAIKVKPDPRLDLDEESKGRIPRIRSKGSSFKYGQLDWERD